MAGKSHRTLGQTTAGKQQQPRRQPTKQQQQQQQMAIKKGTLPIRTKVRKMPKTAAVVLTCPPGQYDATMREAKEKIDLEECGIEKGKGPGIKRAITGALAFEFAGPDGYLHANRVAEKMAALFKQRRHKSNQADKDGRIKNPGSGGFH